MELRRLARTLLAGSIILSLMACAGRGLAQGSGGKDYTYAALSDTSEKPKEDLEWKEIAETGRRFVIVVYMPVALMIVGGNSWTVPLWLAVVAARKAWQPPDSSSREEAVYGKDEKIYE